MSKKIPWTEDDRQHAELVVLRLEQGRATRIELAQLVPDPIKLGLTFGLLRELGRIESAPPLGEPEQGQARTYYLTPGSPGARPPGAPRL